jgi:translation initiation factor 2 beta subunit (eIF-2beta)/eIF-5
MEPLMKDIEIINKIPHGKQDIIYKSGSLAEGLGNDRSDIDIFIITDNCPDTHQFTLSDDGEVIIDVEYWSFSDVENYIAKINSINFQDIQTSLPYVSPDILKFLNNLLVGTALHNKNQYCTIVKAINKSQLSNYIQRLRINQYDNLYEDIVGSIDEGDLDTAFMNSIILSNLSIDALLAFKGNTNPNGKWRVKLLNRFGLINERTNYLSLLLNINTIDMQVIKNIIDFSESIIQNQMRK